MRRIGVLGGSFDPPHLGHLRAAEVVREALSLDGVWFLPSATPPHKNVSEMAEGRHRVHMVERALEGEEHFELSRVEIERGRVPSYTIDTLDELSASLPETKFYFLTGSDAFVEIRTWKRWEELLSRHRFVICERPGVTLGELEGVVPSGVRERLVEISDPLGPTTEGGATLFVVRRPMLPISSTEIRQSVRENRSIRFLVPKAVEAYILENRLYKQVGVVRT